MGRRSVVRLALVSMCKTELALFVALLVGRPAASAAPISLTESQRIKLVEWVATETEVNKLFQKLQRVAEASVNHPGNPIVQIHTAGRLEMDPLKEQSRAGLEDMKKLEALGYAAAVTTNRTYLEAARRIILRWARVNQPTGVPIDETKLEPLWVAYDLTRSAFSPADRKVVEDWLRRVASLELERVQTNSVTAMNNWNSHRLKVVGLIGFLLDDERLIEEAVRGFKRQVALNLQADGSSFDFHQRDALHYHCYDLEPLLVLAIAARQNGLDLAGYQAPTGASLMKSVSFLVPYCDGTTSHVEWVRSRVKFDHERAAAGEKGFQPGTTFHPRDARHIFELTSFFDASYAALALKLSDRQGLKYPNWQAVIHSVRKCR